MQLDYQIEKLRMHDPTIPASQGRARARAELEAAFQGSLPVFAPSIDTVALERG